MISINDLPENYIASMKELLADEFDEYIDSLSKKPAAGLRVNNLKVSNEELLRLLNMELRKVPWIDNAFYTGEDYRFSKSPYYHAGLYYLQEPSAMTTASLSEVEPGDRVLDICAAPGGKSTELASRLNGEGVLYSNDISNSRAKALLKNIELFGVGNAIISSEEPNKLSKVYNNYFDKIIIDAPCSGEGMFRKDKDVLAAYYKRGSEYFVPIQESILEATSTMLRDGGLITYSTCTFSRLEDEDIIIKFLDKHKEFELVDIELKDGFSSSGILKGTARLFPHKLEGEGHFIAKIRKIQSPDDEVYITDKKEKRHKSSKTKLPNELKDFLKHIDRKFDEDRILINREYIYYLPEDSLLDKSIHYLRSGLLLGRINYNRFEPSQAFAMNLKVYEWDSVINLKSDDERVLRYLRGETIESDTYYKDYSLICLEGHPLGFVKQDGHKCKNKYYVGWRIT